jgi:hypothetical protein
VDRYRQERVWDYRDWLPMHFLHHLALGRHQETPVYPFVVTPAPEGLKSEEYHYRVKVELEKIPREIVKVTNIFLPEGLYRIIIKVDSQGSMTAGAELILGFMGHKIEKSVLPIPPKSSLTLTHLVRVEKAGAVDVRILPFGQGTLILDTIRIIPAGDELSQMG